MKRVIKVDDSPDGVFVHMAEMLSVVAPEAAGLQWSILDLGEAFAPEGSEFDVLAGERAVAQSPTGLPLTFRELDVFARGLQQSEAAKRVVSC